MAKTFLAADLAPLVASIIAACGSSAEEARTVADNLVLANLSGHDSHGVGMVPRYVDAVLEGGLMPNAAAQVKLDAGSLLALDGQRGFGQVVGAQAMRLAISRAQESGSCIMALADAHHLGRIGHFAEMAVAHGLVAIHFVNVLSRPVVAPWGGSDGRFGTNPFCVGVPLAGRARPGAGPPQGGAAPSGGSDPHAVGERGGEHFVLDFATSRVAQGKMRVAHNEGRRVEHGYLIDAEGRPTTDPGVVVVPQATGLFGALLPFGEHKGYGMAVACELLGGALTGSGTWHRTPDAKRAVVNGMLTILVDAAKLGTQAAFEDEALAFVDWLKRSPPAPGFDSVLLAGEPERAARAQRERDGIALDDQTWAEIAVAARKVGARV
jgi:uncharacterized oxidoreductase